MKLLITSFAYGLPYPEGVCTKRLVQALRSAHHDVSVLAADKGSESPEAGAVYSPTLTNRFPRLQAAIGSRFGLPCANWDWTLRAGKTSWDVDLVYARYQPLSSLLTGHAIAKRIHKPLVIHFSDPFPIPWTKIADRSPAKMRWIPRLLEAASLVTFTTVQAKDYMERVFCRSLAAKALIVNHIVPDWRVVTPKTPEDDVMVLYAGQFYGNRLPDCLIEGLVLANRGMAKGKFILRLVGTDRWGVERCTRLAAGRVAIDSRPMRPDIEAEYSTADVAIVLDADDSQPMFLPTKAGESVHLSRAVVFISPPASPVRDHFEKGLNTLQFSQHRPDEVAAALLRSAEVSAEAVQDELPHRHRLLTPFRAENVASTLSHRLLQIDATQNTRGGLAGQSRRDR